MVLSRVVFVVSLIIMKAAVSYIFSLAVSSSLAVIMILVPSAGSLSELSVAM